MRNINQCFSAIHQNSILKAGIYCKAGELLASNRNEKNGERKKTTKGAVKKAEGAAIAARPAMATVAKNLKQIEQSGRGIKDVGGKVIQYFSHPRQISHSNQL